MIETHSEPQYIRVLRWLTDNPDSELSQSDTNQWRPPIYRLGAVIWKLRHEHGVDIVKRLEKRRAHYRLIPKTTRQVTQGVLPFSNKKMVEDTKDLAALLVSVSEQLNRLSAALDALSRGERGE